MTGCIKRLEGREAIGVRLDRYRASEEGDRAQGR